MPRKKKSKTQFPVLFYRLLPEDKSYKKGARFAVIQDDGDTHFFKTQRRAEDFILIQGMKPVSPEVMERHRAELP